MAIVPLRRPTPVNEVEDEPKPGSGGGLTKITIGEDGATEIEIGGSKLPSRQKKRASSRDFDANLAEDIDAGSLATLASYLLKGIEADDGDRAEWTETANLAAAYLGVKLEDPASVVAADGTICQAVSVCMLEAAMKLWSTSYAELLPAGGPVKVAKIDQEPVGGPGGSQGIGAVPPAGSAQDPGQMGGPSGGLGTLLEAGGPGAPSPESGGAPSSEPDQAGDDLADALERDMNWYLTVGDRGYYQDTSKMLMMRNLIGIQFKEVYRCSVARKPLSRWIRAQDLIIQGDPPDINETDGRVTVRKKVSQARMKRMQKSGEYLDVPLVRPTGERSQTEIEVASSQGLAGPSLPEDFDHTVYECCCELGSGTNYDYFGDLEVLEADENGDDPGYPLPYRVSLDLDSRTVLAIRRHWKKGDTDHRRKKRFVKYGFIPSFGFYDWGLIHIVGNPTQAATMLQRSGVDASLLANFPAWAQKQGPSTKLETTVYRPGPGEVVKIAASGSDRLSDVLIPWPYKEPSPQSLALLQKLEGDVKTVAGVVEVPVGEGRIGNTPVGTIMSYIESVSMVPGAVHKMDHVAQSEEFQMLRDLIAEEPQVLWRGNRTPARKWQLKEELLSLDLTPQADPNTPSQIHRLLKVQGLVQLGGLPQNATVANNREIYRKAVQVLVGEDAAAYMMPEQAPAPAQPDPRIAAAQIKAETTLQQGQQKQQEAELEHQGRMAELAIEAQQRAADREATNQREAMKLGAVSAKTGADLMTAGAQVSHQQQEGQLSRQHEQQEGQLSRQHEQGMALTQAAMAPPKPEPEGGEGNV
jgi:hypothetical protein